MPRCGATLNESEGRIRTPSSSPPYTLRKGEKDLFPLVRGTPRFVRQGVRKRPPLDPFLAKEGKPFSRGNQLPRRVGKLESRSHTISQPGRACLRRSNPFSVTSV
jgi:hypothetical protein